jgi:hypothetical protein
MASDEGVSEAEATHRGLETGFNFALVATLAIGETPKGQIPLKEPNSRASG